MTDFATLAPAFTAFAVELADAARRLQAEFSAAALDIEVKPDRSFVTALDTRIEAHLRAMIQQRWPDHGIIGEEEDWLDPDAEHVWVLDPIDGTAAFIAGIPVHGTLIALAHRRRPMVGIVDIPGADARWIGVHGEATRLNGAACRVKPCAVLSDAVLSTSNPDFYAADERPVLERLRQATRWRIYGGAALSYGRLAEGRIDVAVDAGLKIFDFAPFRPIIEGAGGMITDWAGTALTLDSGSRILAAGSRDRHAEALDLIATA